MRLEKTPVAKLLRPMYLHKKGSKVVHLARPTTFEWEGRDTEEKGVFPIEDGSRTDYRCESSVWLARVTGYHRKPKDIPLCKRCVNSIRAALLAYVEESLLYYVTHTLLDHHVPLQYYYTGSRQWSGTTMTNDVTARHGENPGTVKFRFKAYDIRQEFEITLLDLDTWTWSWGDTTLNLGVWIAHNLLEQLRDVESKITQTQIAEVEDAPSA